MQHTGHHLQRTLVPARTSQPLPAPDLAPAHDPGFIAAGARAEEALAATHGNQTHAAARLGISRRGLIYKMERYGLKRRG